MRTCQHRTLERKMKKFVCPLCKKKVNEYPAISRQNNKTEICSSCGQKEALLSFIGFLKSDGAKK